MKHARKCQQKLHDWGKPNQVEFEPKKETITIMSRISPQGPGFKLLGVHFDTGLKMEEAISKLHSAATWKVTKILRSRKYYDAEEIMTTYKTKVLSYLEYRTPAIYHAASSHLKNIDGIQKRLIREINITEATALFCLTHERTFCRRPCASIVK